LADFVLAYCRRIPTNSNKSVGYSACGVLLTGRLT